MKPATIDQALTHIKDAKDAIATVKHEEGFKALNTLYALNIAMFLGEARNFAQQGNAEITMRALVNAQTVAIRELADYYQQPIEIVPMVLQPLANTLKHIDRAIEQIEAEND